MCQTTSQTCPRDSSNASARSTDTRGMSLSSPTIRPMTAGEFFSHPDISSKGVCVGPGTGTEPEAPPMQNLPCCFVLRDWEEWADAECLFSRNQACCWLSDTPSLYLDDQFLVHTSSPEPELSDEITIRATVPVRASNTI